MHNGAALMVAFLLALVQNLYCYIIKFHSNLSLAVKVTDDVRKTITKCRKFVFSIIILLFLTVYSKTLGKFLKL